MDITNMNKMNLIFNKKLMINQTCIDINLL